MFKKKLADPQTILRQQQQQQQQQNNEVRRVISISEWGKEKKK